MKKLKLLIGIAALLLGGANSVNAQKDVTSQYITNATLSDGTNGWTASNFNAPQQGNNTKGYASEAYAGWGSLETTSFSLTQNITLPAGKYTLVSYSFFRQGEADDADHNSKSLANLKAGSKTVALKTLRSITAAGYANSQPEGANAFDSKMYRNTLDFTIDADNTTIEIGIEGTFDEMRSWCIAGMFELIDNGQAATMDSPFDVTGYITNPGFEYRDMTGWTLSENEAFNKQNNAQSFKVGGYYAEKWQASGALTARSMSQTLKNLPEGLYRLTANLGGDGTYIDLNGKTASWTEDKDYTVGYVLSENEDLVITAGKTAEGTANWIHFDNFKLYFCGDVTAALTTLCGQVTNYDDKIPSAAYSTLQTNVAAQNKSYSDVDELLAAIDAVQALYDAADLLVAPYAAWMTAKDAADADYSSVASVTAVATAKKPIVDAATAAADITAATTELTAAMNNYDEYVALKAKADILVAVANDNASANSTLATAISTATTNIEAPTTATGIAEVASTLKTAMQTYVFAATPVGDGAKFDCTFLMTNPDLTGLATLRAADGWKCEEADGNSQVMVNDSKTVGDKSYFYEYWSNPAKASGKFALYNAVTLPEGTFSMSCYAFAENQYAASTVDGVYFYANDTQGSCVTATVLTEQTLSFVNSAEQEVKIGLKTVTGNTRNWMGIGYIELYKVPAAAAVALDESVAYVEAATAADVKLTKTIYEGWNTVVLPFSMTADEVATVLGAGKLYAFTGADAGSLNFSEASALSAHTPYLFKADAVKNISGETISGRTITVSSNGLKTAGTDYNFVGTYTPYAQGESPIEADADYVLGTDANFHKATVKNAMKAFRAYIQANKADEPTPARLAIVIDGETTAIEAIDGRVLNNAAIYNLAGQKVQNAQKGIFIQNGKKVVK